MVNLDVIRERLFRTQVVFTACALCAFVILGIQSTFSIPPFQIPDESRHWIGAVARTNSLTSFFGGSSKKPECSVEFGLIAKMAQDNLAFQPTNRIPTNTFGSLGETTKECKSSDLLYGNLFTYPGVIVSKLILKAEDKRAFAALTGFYVSRIIHGLLVFVLFARLLTLAFRAKFMPIGVVLLAGLATSPLFVQQSFAVSGDPICFMLVLSLLSLIFFPSLVTRFDVGMAVMFAVVASHTKPPMALFALSAAVLMFFRGGATSYRVALYSIVLASVLGSISVGLSYGASNPSSHPDAPSGISMGQQIAFMIDNPRAAFQAINRATAAVLGIDQVAHPLGWVDTFLPARVLSTWHAILWLALILEVGGLLQVRWAVDSLKQWGNALSQSVIFLLGIYVATLATPLILYLAWTPVGAAGVDGMQSRYLFPSLFLMTAALCPLYRSDRHSESLSPIKYHLEALVIVPLMTLLCALYVSELHIAVIARYW
jgi:hypothetical protein